MATAQPAPQPPSPRDKKVNQLKRLRNSPLLGRFAIVNHFNSQVAQIAPTAKYPRLSAFFVPHNTLKWVKSYLKFAFQPKYPFPDYSQSRKSGLYPITPVSGTDDTITIGIVGDWGTGTDQAEKIAERISRTDPDFTIHLGDVYYVGGESEIAENCLGQKVNGFDGVTFPHGRQGSFALNGNHEMYANGTAYFTTFLKTLGLKGDAEGQLASFFALETDAWRILAIDTGYNSVGIPILSQIPFVKQIPAIGGDCHLETKLLDWLRNTVKPSNRRKATLILSHHEYFTKFKDANYTKPAQQLTEFFKDQDVVWLWGHEHRLAIYDSSSEDGGIKAYGRCVGHGGMPVENSAPIASKNAPLRFYDTRPINLDGTSVCRNGYVTAKIRNSVLSLEYRDIDNTLQFSETFTAGAQGALQYSFNDPGVLQKA